MLCEIIDACPFDYFSFILIMCCFETALHLLLYVLMHKVVLSIVVFIFKEEFYSFYYEFGDGCSILHSAYQV